MRHFFMNFYALDESISLDLVLHGMEKEENVHLSVFISVRQESTQFVFLKHVLVCFGAEFCAGGIWMCWLWSVPYWFSEMLECCAVNLLLTVKIDKGEENWEF